SVDDDRGAMGKEIDRCRIDTAFGEHVQHTLFEVRRRGIRLGRDDARNGISRFRLEGDQIGERAADIGRYADRLVGHHAAPMVSWHSLRRKQTAPGSFKASAAATLSSV